MSSTVELIKDAGYPAEEHNLATDDGYILHVERIPRKEARGVVFFMHGVLDTSMTWVTAGAGSQAYAVWEAGYDVWLGNSRCNTPCLHQDPDKSADCMEHWRFSNNELGMYDVPAQLEYIHQVKLHELQGELQEGSDEKQQRLAATLAVTAGPLAAAQLDGMEGKQKSSNEKQQRLAAAPAAQLDGMEGKQKGSNEKQQRLAATVAVTAGPPTAPAAQIFGIENRHAAAQLFGMEDKHAVSELYGLEMKQAAPPELIRKGPLGSKSPSATHEHEPYTLHAVGHSLGGMSLLVHGITAAAAGKPSRVHRYILYAPGGLHGKMPLVAYFISYIMPIIAWLIRLFWPSMATPIVIPTRPLRGAVFNTLQWALACPFLSHLFRTLAKVMLGGDPSQWDCAVKVPHYSAHTMPAASLDQFLHAGQLGRSGHFRLYDYGSADANMAAYGTRHPPDMGEHYNLLGGVKVDLVGGTVDGVVPACNIQEHYKAMKAANVNVSYTEFGVGHVDFTLAENKDLKKYLLNVLQQD